MNTTTRRAADAEIVAVYAHRARVSFTGWCLEVSDSRSANGVRHITKFSSKLRVIDGVPHGLRCGQLYPLIGTVYELGGGRELVADLRMA
jgi:hypothetical protein